MGTVRAELREATRPARRGSTAGKWRVLIIEADVNGSSGYYPAAVLAKAAEAKVFRQGMQMYLDHPTSSEEWERPERSVRDLAGVLLEDAVYENGADGHGLFATVQFLGEARDLVADLSENQLPDTVGLSIRAIGITEENPDTGTLVVTEIVEGLSVDVVTRAGAGGKLVSIAESARQGGGESAPKAAPIFELKESDKVGMNRLAEKMDTLAEKMIALEKRLTEAEERSAQTPSASTGPMHQAPGQGPNDVATGGASEDTGEHTDGGAAALGYGEVVDKLDSSGLPAASRKRLANDYRPGQDLDAAIAAEKALVDEIQESLTARAPGGVLRESGALGGSSEYETQLRSINTRIFGGSK